MYLPSEFEYSDRIYAPKPMGCHEASGGSFVDGFEKENDMILNGNLDNSGFSVINVLIENQITKEQVMVEAVLDTGAWPCLIKQTIIDELGLNPIGSKDYDHPKDGIINSNEYMATLKVGENMGYITFSNAPIGLLHSKSYPYDMILGVCFLKYCKFIYDGLGKKFELHL